MNPSVGRRVLLFSAFAAYCAVLALLSIKRYAAFNCDVDMGNILQAFYNTLQGRFMEMTANGGDANACRWSGHTEIIFTLLIPFFKFFPCAQTLLIAQTLVIGAAGLAVFVLARERLENDKTALILALAFWVFPYLHIINLSDFHSDAFMILPYLLSWHFLKKGRPALFWLMISLGTLCKEYACVLNLLLGIMIWKEHRREGLALIGLAFFQYLILTPLVMKMSGAGGYALATESHAVILPGGRGWGKAAGKILSGTVTADYLLKLLTLLVIFNFTLLRFKRGLVVILPLLGALSMLYEKGLFINHRHAILVAPLFIVLIEGVRTLNPAIRLRHAFLFTLLPCLAVTFFFPGSLFGSNVAEMFFHPQYRNTFHYRYTNHDRIADSLLAAFVPRVPVAAESNLRTKTADRRFSFQHPYPSDASRAESYVFDFFEALDYAPHLKKRERCAALLKSGLFSVQSSVDGLLLLKKGPADTLLFSLSGKDSLTGCPAGGDGIQILEKGLSVFPDGYFMNVRFRKDSGSARGDAFISFFMDGKDTIRVLHVPTYVFTSLPVLAPGVYEERFFFQVPQGKSLEGRRHVIALYEKDAYLPLMSRPGQQVRVFR